MTLEPFYNASPAIQIHMVAAIGAFVLGATVLWKKKGGKVHKLNGRIWVALMMITAFSGFFIHEIRMWGDFSPIHIISALVPVGLIHAIYEARMGKIDAHQRSMKSTYVGGMIVAGGFTFFPSRLNYEILFGDKQWAGFSIPVMLLLILAGAIVIAWCFSSRRAA